MLREGRGLWPREARLLISGRGGGEPVLQVNRQECVGVVRSRGYSNADPVLAVFYKCESQ